MVWMPAWRPRLAWMLALVACVLLPWLTAPALAAVQPVPALSAHVIDQTATLSTQETAQLEAQLTALERAISDYWNRDIPVQTVQQTVAKILQDHRRLP